MIKILFVCLGNICRSPTAHGVFVQQVKDAGLSDAIEVDSAGTSGWHNGASPDSRSMAEAQRHGYDLSFIKSRPVTDNDFEEQDYILAMDRENLKDLLERSPAQHRHKIRLFLEYATGSEQEVPDPYYGGDKGFTQVLKLVEQGGVGLLTYLKQQHFDV